MTQTPAGGDLRTRVEAVLDTLRPYIQMDGGNVEVVDVKEQDGAVFLRMVGACHG